MAVDTAPLLTRLSHLAYKIETTTGTAIAISATDATVPVMNLAMTPDIPAVEVAEATSLSPRVQGLGARSGTCEFEIEVAGKGSTAAPAWFDIMQACGMTLTSMTLTPKDGATTTLTMGDYESGLRAAMIGCMGNWVLTKTAGQAAKLRFSMRGVWDTPTDVAMLTPTWVSTIAPRSAPTFTIGSTTYYTNEFSLDLGNTVVLRGDVTAQDSGSVSTGYRAAYVTARRPILRCAVEANLLATKDWWSLHSASTTSAISIVLGSAANNTFTITIPKAQLVSAPTFGDREGIRTVNLEFLCTRNTNGGDELSIAAS